ncbi:hypothetical protein [uncultured Brevundimonas sp.]|uniref:hypothetical protein n=1 Tax=uncultured Brevundimonas sp. TaxID=213418 RepID=UPI0026395440|nr:hypothetical protein [uncultured Brevundimonas sp.]
MKAVVAGLGLMVMLGACAPDTRMPESSYQWERRQARIEREWRDDQAQQAPSATASAQTSTNGAPAPEDRF